MVIQLSVEKQGIIQIPILISTKTLSTILALIEITENIRKSIKNKLYTVGIYSDLSKAFDMHS